MGHYTRSLGKVLATVALLAVLALVLALSFALLPLLAAMAFAGRAKISSMTELLPVAAILALLWKIWKKETEPEPSKSGRVTTVEKTVIIPTTAKDYDREFEKSLDRYHRQRERERESNNIPF